jgi:GT2 family glycosyltransferase
MEEMCRNLNLVDGLVMGTPRYLYDEPAEDFTNEILFNESIEHHKRPTVEAISQCKDPGLFWSLCFSITKERFDFLGGFDPNYFGYGAEDTDMSFTCQKEGVPFYLSPTIAYHQHHGFYSPPVDKMESIISNCNYFYSKWGVWPMDKHLKAFARQGFVKWDENTNEPISLNEQPDPFTTEQFYVNDRPYA